MEDKNEIRSRKKDHIDLAFESQTKTGTRDERFYYEPLLSAHPLGDSTLPKKIGNKKMKWPIWISSMTGGAEYAHTINKRLAEACHEFGLGMGLGSCRVLLDQPETIVDFDLRDTIGDDLPFYSNWGIAQIEKAVKEPSYLNKILKINDQLRVDGMIIHVNPLQEFIQPGGDRLAAPPAETISRWIELTDASLIVKEVGQGMGPESIRKILRLPLTAFDFGAYGGTNFALLESIRSDEDNENSTLVPLASVGHSALEMIEWINASSASISDNPLFIISGGIRNFLDGYYCIQKIKYPAVYGQASSLLKHALESQEALDNYLKAQTKGLALANAFLKIKEESHG